MSALYGMRVVISGGDGKGLAAIYIGKGMFLGADMTGTRYKGSYTEQNGKLKFTGTISVPAGSTTLSGKQFAEATDFPMQAELSEDFADGTAQTVKSGDTAIQVTFHKVGDIP